MRAHATENDTWPPRRTGHFDGSRNRAAYPVAIAPGMFLKETRSCNFDRNKAHVSKKLDRACSNALQ